MQSFSMWHDASHPFHVTDVECERFESISHTPTLDLATIPFVHFRSYSNTAEPTASARFIPAQIHANQAIRAPPFFHS